MTRRKLPAALCLLLATQSAPVAALGVGAVVNQTALGQALQLSVGVRLDEGEALRSDCVGVEVQSGDSRVSPLALRWAVEPGADAPERTLRIQSNVVIDEPVVTVRLQIACSGTRLTREFVLLIDPPGVALAQVAPPPAAAPRPGAAPGEIPVAAAQPLVGQAAAAATVPASAVRPRRAVPARSAAPRAGSASASVAKAAVAGSKRASSRPTPAAVASGSRLKLEAAEPTARQVRSDPTAGAPALVAAVPAVAPAASASAALASAAASAPEAAASQPGTERLQALEASLAALTQESRKTRADMAELQARLREAQAARYANGLVYGLGALAALLALALGAVLWRRSAGPAVQTQWWNSALQREHGMPAAAEAASGRAGDSGGTALAETTASPMLLQQAAAVQAETSRTERHAAPVDPAVAAEELMDLEQQAEFFVVLGQDEAAIELLASHLDSSGAASPLPYLKLLEIHRRRGEREASERIRERFNRRFNAYAPEWPADPMAGRGLMDYPQLLANLQRLWSQPERALRALQASLLRRDGAEPTFDLPAYRELLFLYAVARDLAEREQEPASVDLLLPIDASAGGPEPAKAPPHAARDARSASPQGVDVDIGALAALPPDEPVRRRDPGPSSYATPLDSGAIGLRH